MRKLTALKAFSYGRLPNKRAFWPGDEFEALSERDAKWLIAARRAKVAQPPEPAVLVPAASTPVEPTRRRYKRRDMEAETFAMPAAPPVPPTISSPGGGDEQSPDAVGTTPDTPTE